MRVRKLAGRLGFAVAALAGCGMGQANAQPAAPPYQVEWVYKVQYGHQDEWWRLFQKYQIPILDREKQLGFVRDYTVFRPSLHQSEDARWDFRIVITYPDWQGSTHEGEVDRQLFADRASEARDEQRRWELTLNHWDLPIRQVDPHGDG